MDPMLAIVQAIAARLLAESNPETRMVNIRNLITHGMLPKEALPVNPLPADYSRPVKGDPQQLAPPEDPENPRPLTRVIHSGPVSANHWRGIPGGPREFATGNAPRVSGSCLAPRDGETGKLGDLRREIHLDREELRHALTVWYRGLNESQKRRVRRFIGARPAFIKR